MKILLKRERPLPSKGRAVLRGIILIFLLLMIPVAYFVPQLVIRGKLADYYAEKIFPIISLVPQAINGVFITSLTELFVVVGFIFLIALIIMFIAKCILIAYKQDMRHVLHYAYIVLRAVAVIGIAAAMLFELMLGINYNRTSVRKRMHLYGDTRPYEDYEETLMWAYLGMVTARQQLGEDYNGVAHMISSFETTVFDANAAVNTVSYFYDLGLSENYVRGKAVWLSRLWSYTGIVGMYDPFLSEVIINTDYIDVLHFPVTVCHEMCHAKGYASETDANTIAVISCINSERPDFRYAGYYYIFVRLWSTVNDYATSEGVAMFDYTSQPEFEAVARDMKAYNMYRDSFNDGPIADFIERFSEDVNNAYLESNGQDGGTQTYIVPQNAYVEYYCRFIRDNA